MVVNDYITYCIADVSYPKRCLRIPVDLKLHPGWIEGVNNFRQ
jgi:hypothetical protein